MKLCSLVVCLPRNFVFFACPLFVFKLYCDILLRTWYVDTRGLSRQPSIAGSRDAQTVSNVVARDGGPTCCEEYGVIY